MVKLKKYNAFTLHFVLFLTFLMFTSCNQQKYYVTKITAKEYKITDSITKNAAIDDFIKPYREHIDKDLDQVLAYSPETLDKSGQWQTSIGNLYSDITLQYCNPIFNKREGKSIDICLLNIGGIRSIIPKGNVSARVAYQIMPFENTTMVVALKGEQILEIVNYIIENKKAHPLSGMTFTINENYIGTNILVQGKPLEMDKTYYVVTSDYLVNGGDNMTFFKKGTAKYDLDYKLRNVLIDYFTAVDTIKVNNNKRITVE